MLELFNFPYSTCSQKVRICLAEKGLQWVDRRVDARKAEHLSAEYLRINPNGVVPTLVHDGRPVIESSVIVEYLDQVFPDPPLSPADPYELARMRAWLRFIDEVPTAAIRVPSFNKFLLQFYRPLSDDDFADAAHRRPLRKQFYERMGRAGFSDADYRASLEQLERAFARMAAALDSGPWLLGQRFGLADVCMAPLIDRAADLGLARLWEPAHPAVGDWYRRLQQRPSFRAAFSEGARLSEIYRALE